MLFKSLAYVLPHTVVVAGFSLVLFFIEDSLRVSAIVFVIIATGSLALRALLDAVPRQSSKEGAD